MIRLNSNFHLRQNLYSYTTVCQVIKGKRSINQKFLGRLVFFFFFKITCKWVNSPIEREKKVSKAYVGGFGAWDFHIDSWMLSHVCPSGTSMELCWSCGYLLCVQGKVESRECWTDGEGTGTRACHISISVWRTDWELVVLSGWGATLFCPIFCGRRTSFTVSAWLRWSSLVARGYAAELQPTVSVSSTLSICA